MQQSRIESLIVQYGLSDLAIAIGRDNNEILSAGFGHSDAACKQPITPDTIFGVASVTKLITTITILLLQERGQLSLLDAVKQYYPTLKAASNPNLKLHHLLCHTSGWPGMASRFKAIDESNPDGVSGGLGSNRSNDHNNEGRLHNTDDLVSFMNHQDITPLAEPGRLLSYSNEGFCLLGGVIEQLTGSSWQQNIEDMVFRPLNMSHSSIGLPDPARFDFIAEPIVTNDKKRSVVGIWDAPLFYPAGGVVASVRDLLRLMTVLSPHGPLLDPASRAQLLTPALSVASRTNDNFGYSPGLEYRQFDNGPIMHWHTGQRAGVSSLVAALPAAGLSIALASNTSDAPLTAIAHQVIADLVGDCDPHWPPAINEPEVQTTGPDPCGHYGSDEGFSYLVTNRNGVFCLRHQAEDTEQALHFRTATSGYVGQQTFAFLKNRDAVPNYVDQSKVRPDTTPWALAMDLRVLPRIN